VDKNTVSQYLSIGINFLMTVKGHNEWRMQYESITGSGVDPLKLKTF